MTREIRSMMNAATSSDPIGGAGWQNTVNKYLVGVGEAGVRVIGDSENVNASPMMRLRTVGNALQYWSWGIKGINALINSVGKGTEIQAKVLSGKAGGVGAVLIAAMMMLVAAIQEMYALLAGISDFMTYLGFFLANIAPSIPMILYFMATIGVFIYVIESALGANFGWAMKAHHKGDDWAGSSISVYKVALAVFLKAPLLVVGFIVGTSIHWVGYTMINTLFSPSVFFANIDQALVNIYAFLGAILVWAILQTVLAMKSYGLANEINNGLMRFIGIVDQRDLGETRDEGRMMAMIGTAGQRMMAAGVVKGGGAGTQAKDKAASTDKASKGNADAGGGGGDAAAAAKKGAKAVKGSP